MTTHETRPETVEPVPAETAEAPAHAAELPAETAEAPSHAVEAPAETAEAPAHAAEAPAEAANVPPEAADTPIEADPPRVSEPVETDAPTKDLESGPDQMLFADAELSDLRSRWTEVQSAFVDDPRDCVHKADGLVADVVERLTAGFSEARSQLEEQWDRGEKVSTEDLRIALKRYRDFFERLLAV